MIPTPRVVIAVCSGVLAVRALWGWVVWQEPPHVPTGNATVISGIAAGVTACSGLLAGVLVPFIRWPRLMAWLPTTVLFISTLVGVVGWKVASGSPLGLFSAVAAAVCAVGVLLLILSAPTGQA